MKIFKRVFYNFMYGQIIPIGDISNRGMGCEVKTIREAYRFTPRHCLYPGNSSRGISFEPHYNIDPFWVIEAYDVYLIGPYGLPINSKGKIIEYANSESVKKVLGRTIRHMGFIRFMWTYAKVVSRRRSYDVESGLHLVPRHGYVPGVPNYCHWMLESLPQLYVSEAYSVGHVIINNQPFDWQLQSLKRLGFRAPNIWAHNGDVTRVKKILFTSIRSAASSGSDRDPRLRQWLKEKLLAKTISQPNADKRIFISRQNMSRGHISNFLELEQLLAKYSVEVYEPGKNGLENDLAVFRNASLLIGPHGAGLANMIFTSKTKVAVVEISCGEKWETDFFYHTAVEMNYDFESVQAKVDEKPTARMPELTEPWTIDIAQLESVIAEVVSRQSEKSLRRPETHNEYS